MKFGEVLMITLKRVTAIISNPPAYLNEVREQPLKNDVLFFIGVTILGSLLYLGFAVIENPVYTRPAMLSPLGIVGMSLTMMALFVIDGLEFVLLISLVEHFFVLFTDEHRDFEKTMKSGIYASALPVLFVWTIHNVQYSVPVLLAAFLVVTYISIRMFHGITKDRAAFVAIFTTGFITFLLCLGKVNLLGTI